MLNSSLVSAGTASGSADLTKFLYRSSLSMMVHKHSRSSDDFMPRNANPSTTHSRIASSDRYFLKRYSLHSSRLRLMVASLSCWHKAVYRRDNFENSLSCG